jgi:hypothetical protein
VRLVAEIKQLEREKKNAARRERRLRKKIADLKTKTEEAQEELRKATAHSEAQVRTMLKMEDDKGWRRRVAEAERKLNQSTERRGQTRSSRRKFQTLASFGVFWDLPAVKTIVTTRFRSTPGMDRTQQNISSACTQNVVVHTRWSCVRLRVFSFQVAARRERSVT